MNINRKTAVRLFIAIALTLCSWLGPAVACAESIEYHRIVILSDAHLPTTPRENADPAKQARILAAKQKLLTDLNDWTDVGLVVATGDVVASYGADEEYAAARDFFGGLIQPQAFLVGNHDYIYNGRNEQYRLIRGDAAQRQAKLERFRREFEQSQLYYTQQRGRYLLVFLSADSLDSKVLCQFSHQQMTWLANVLAENKTRPTIIFAHAPLAGTLTNYNKNINTPSFIAQPEQEIRQVLHKNPQVFLWVSGHTHTPPTNPDFAATINLYDGQVRNIHNPDLDREVIWTNSLYLYPDKVVIKTFRHSDQTWLDQLERTIEVQ